MNSLEIIDRKQQLLKQAQNIADACKAEIRMMNPEEQSKFTAIKEEINNLNAELRNIETTLNPLTKQTKTMEKNFSLIKAIRSVANNKALDSVESAVVEAGASEMRKAGINYVGQIQLPSAETRGIQVTGSTGEHDDVVATDLFDVVKPLQARNVMIQAGAKFVTGLVGDLQYPVMSNANVTWEGEVAAAKDGSPTFTNVKLSPKRLTAVVPISKQFIVQDSVGAENAIREEIINALNAKLEATILGSGAGSATEPRGIFDIVAPTAVGTFSDLVDKEADLEGANVYGEMTYVLSPKAKSALRSMIKGTNGTGMVFENGEVDGTKAFSTSHVKGTDYLYGDFSQYIIGQWGNIDLTVDTVTLAADGQIRLVVNAYFDAKPLRNAAFVAGTL